MSRDRAASPSETVLLRVLGLLLLVSAGALGAALYFQHVGGLVPCRLCIVQRYPYWFALPLTVMALGFGLIPARFGFDLAGWRAVFLAPVVLAFAMGAGFAFFHFGIELGWWPAPSTCQLGGEMPGSLAAAKALMALGESAPPCDKIPWSLFGLSMAGWNFLIALGGTALGLWGLWRYFKSVD